MYEKYSFKKSLKADKEDLSAIVNNFRKVCCIQYLLRTFQSVVVVSVIML